MESIKLNDILNLSQEDINKTKIRFMTKDSDGEFDPISIAKNEKDKEKLNKENLVRNRSKGGFSFKKGNIAIGFIPLPENADRWLMTGIVRVEKDNGPGEPADMEYYKTKKFNFRLIVKYHKAGQNGIRKANELIDELEVVEIWNPEKKLVDISFPGYKNVSIGYDELKKKIEISNEWRTALRSRKGIYLITDKNGKLYVGSAYGKEGILGRWRTYLESGYDRNEKENGKYPNKKFQELVKKE